MKRLWFWGALLLIGVSWVINIAIYETQRLDGPIVLEHYIELPMEQNHFFKIFYLTNKNNPAILQSMEVDGLSISTTSLSDDMWIYDNQNSIHNTPNIVQEFNHHLLLEADFDASMLSLEANQDKALIWTNVYLTFSDGTAKDFDIGEIHLTPSTVKQESKLTSMFTGGTSNGLHSSIYVAEEQLLIDEFVLPQVLSENVQVKVHYEGEKARVSDAIYQSEIMPSWNDVSQPLAKDIDWPIDLEPQGSVGLYVQIDPSFTTAIDARIKWMGETAEGEKFIAPLALQHIPELTDESLQKIIKQARDAS